MERYRDGEGGREGSIQGALNVAWYIFMSSPRRSREWGRQLVEMRISSPPLSGSGWPCLGNMQLRYLTHHAFFMATSMITCLGFYSEATPSLGGGTRPSDLVGNPEQGTNGYPPYQPGRYLASGTYGRYTVW